MDDKKPNAKRPASPTVHETKRSNLLTVMQRAQRCAMTRDRMIEPNAPTVG